MKVSSPHPGTAKGLVDPTRCGRQREAVDAAGRGGGVLLGCRDAVPKSNIPIPDPWDWYIYLHLP